MEYENQQESMDSGQFSTSGQPEEGQNGLSEQGVSKNLIITVVIAVVVVVLALMYVWGSKVGEPEILPPAFPAEDEQTMDLKKVSESDEIEAIEQDLLNTDLENLDADLNTFEAEIDTLVTE